MEDDSSDDSSPEREISPAEADVPVEAMDENSSSAGNLHSSSEANASASLNDHILHGNTNQTNLLELRTPVPTRGWSNLYLISNTWETVPVNQNSWTDTRRFLAIRDPYMCSIPKRLVANGTIRQTLIFVSKYTLRNLRMKLQLMFRNRIVDEWQFKKGLVNRGEITRWETTIIRSPYAHYFDTNFKTCTLLYTKFYDGDQLLYMYDTCIFFI